MPEYQVAIFSLKDFHSFLSRQRGLTKQAEDRFVNALESLSKKAQDSGKTIPGGRIELTENGSVVIYLEEVSPEPVEPVLIQGKGPCGS